MTAARAFVIDTADGSAGVREVDVLDPAAGEVRVRLVASGVCATDAHLVDGTSPPPVSPVILGHEGAGIVEAVGAGVTTLSEGDQVLFARSGPCGTCRECRRGYSADCDSAAFRNGLLGVMDDGTTRVRWDGKAVFPYLGGTLSEHMTLRAGHVVRIDPDVPLEQFCLVGCAVITGFGAVVNSGRVEIGDTVLVVGCGGVGINVIQAARIAGATTIVAVDPVREKRALAEKLGATHSIDSAGFDEVVAEIAPGGVDVAFEVVGAPALVAECVRLTRVGGTTVVVGVPPAGADLPIPNRELLNNRRVIGCRGGGGLATRDVPRLLDLYRNGDLQLEPLIGETLPLDDVQRALDGVSGGQIGRSVIAFS